MPRKLKAYLIEVVLLTIGFSTAFRVLEVLQHLIQLEDLGKVRVVGWSLALATLAWKAWQFYVGVVRDGTYLYDDSRE